MLNFSLAVIITLLIISNSHARPISYSGGKTIMYYNNGFKHSLHLHYSPSYKYSLGYRYENYKNTDLSLDGIQLNNLIKRWNLQEAQGNIYLKSSLGNASSKGNNQLYGFVGLAGDFETRKYFIAYENKYYKANGNILDKFEQNARIAIAPYLANYGQIHSWLMLEISRQKINSKYQNIVTPLIRLFKKNNLVEIGYNNKDKLLVNFISRF
ncbi:MAG: hypothetical protein ACO2XZ_02855 [Rickettsiales bacterium]